LFHARQRVAHRKNGDERFAVNGFDIQAVIRKRQAQKADVDGAVQQAFHLTGGAQVSEIKGDLRMFFSEGDHDAGNDFQCGRRDKAQAQSAEFAARRALGTVDRQSGPGEGGARFGQEYTSCVGQLD